MHQNTPHIISLTLRRDTLFSEDLGFYDTYGIDVYDASSREFLYSIPDITPSRDVLLSFIARCHRAGVCEAHLRELVDDLLIEQ